MDWRRQSSAPFPPRVLGLRSAGGVCGTVPLTPCEVSFSLSLSLLTFLFFLHSHPAFSSLTHNLHSAYHTCINDLLKICFCSQCFILYVCLYTCLSIWYKGPVNVMSGYIVSCHWVWSDGSLLACSCRA